MLVSQQTTQSMENKGNAAKRLVIWVLKLFSICRRKKHKKESEIPDKCIKRA
jgi:hypothetical protein